MVKNVVITGANRGIGLSLCKYFDSSGHNVFGVCRKSSFELENIAESIISGIDIGNAQDCNKLGKKMSGIRVDILINNAGILLSDELDNVNFFSIEKQFQVNALGALRVVECLRENLSKTSKVAIITSRMGSISDNGSGGRYGYRMSKAALNAAAKSLAIDLKPKGIPVGIYHPGFVATDMTRGRGDICADTSAKKIGGLIDTLDLGDSGIFRHSNGEILPW